MAAPQAPIDPPAAAAETQTAAPRERLALAWTLLHEGYHDASAEAARQALARDAGLAPAALGLAQALVTRAALPEALAVCQAALERAPQSREAAAETGRLALRLGRFDVAEQALAARLQAAPSVEATIDLAHAQRGLRAFDRAQATLTPAIKASPAEPRLWLALADLLGAQGRHAEAIVFYDEALRLDPRRAAALDGLADALLQSQEDMAPALEASEAAVAAALPDEAPRLRAAHARRLLAAGRLQAGWAAFAAAFPGDSGEVEIRVAAPRWTPGAPVAGQLVVFGEPDIAAEILLAQAIPDLVERQPRLILAVRPGWAALAQRSFPGVRVVSLLSRREGERLAQAADLDTPHRHGGDFIDAWTPLRATPAMLRGELAAFEGASPYLRPDPHRIAFWRSQLAADGPGPKVGVLWRSPSDRAWEAPPLSALAGVLSSADFRFIGIQGEAVLGELAWIRQATGLPIQDPPPGFRPTDLDEAAALANALDAVLGVPDAVSYVAAASGANTWFLAPRRHWALLGRPAYPWFETAKVFAAAGPTEWGEAIAGVERALHELRGTLRASDPAAGLRPDAGPPVGASG